MRQGLGWKRLAAIAALLAICTIVLVGAACGDSAGSADGAVDETTPASTPPITVTLLTTTDDDGLAFIGVGGDIDGVRNPTLQFEPGDVVEVALENGDGVEHDIFFPEFEATTDRITEKGATTSIVLEVDKDGQFTYFCSVPGHRQSGMEGQAIAGTGGEQEAVTGSDIVREPTDLPPPIGDRPAEAVRVDLVAIELEGQLAEGTTYNYWTFDGKVPGPFLRVREGDTVELHLRNPAGNTRTHPIDLHAVTGPGGGATVMQVPPGEEKAFTFKALRPGPFVYHCATASVAHHITNGMYGLILVEPEGGLPPVHHEFYVTQGEIYTLAPFGEKGILEFSNEKLLAEPPEYFLVNGAVGALTEQHPLKAKVGETVRIFFGVGGPNFTSSFHVIGKIFDRVYTQGSLTSAPLTDVQTTTVAPGGVTVVEFTVEVPGRYLLVDHALSRLERGLVGYLDIEGAENPEVFHEGPVQ